MATETIIHPNVDFEAKAKFGQWQPIETAPRDGTRVYLAYDTGPLPTEWNMGIARYFNVGWVESNSPTNYGSPIAYHPINWMPLPDPPD